MPSQKIRAFLATDVLLEYIRGKTELQHLFSDEVRERAVFAINDVVLQELLLSQDKANRIDLEQIVPYVEIVSLVFDALLPETQAMLRELRNRAMHVNDGLILAGARSCDVLLTYSTKLRDLGQATAVRSETPEEFLSEVGAAA